MGSCFSSSSSTQPQPDTATVIAVNGELKEFPTPINVQQVLAMLQTQKTDVDKKGSNVDFVLCNSDSLCFDEYIPTMKQDDQLYPNEIYFLITSSRLQYRLSSTDMAAMAVKVSVALTQRDGKRKKICISPVSDAYLESKVQETITPYSRKAVGSDKKGGSSGASYVRSGSIRRLQRYSSRRVKLAVRSFRLMLSTIYE